MKKANPLKKILSCQTKNSIESLCRVEKNLYSQEDFMLRLTLEKRRAERSSCKSSLILFDLKHLVNGYAKFINLEDVIRLICRTIRLTDIGMLYKKEAIVLLLPDTSSRGAECLSKRIMQHIADFYASRVALTHENFHIRILSFPERQVDSIYIDDVIVKDFDVEPDDVLSCLSRYQDMPFNKVYHDDLSLCESSFNGSAISMSLDDLFFWDIKIVSSYLLKMKHNIKKTMDIFGAILALILFLPFMLFIAVGVKLSSPGPILFKQTRIGYRGRPFTFLKFRSMRCEKKDDLHQEYVKKLIQGETEQLNKGTDQHPCYKMNDDPRITAFGCFLRKTSLDELPQLFNVLRGEMSLVGPRPPLEYEVKEYKYWHWRRVLEVKPGITGLWQVSGRNRLSFADMVRLDIYYSEHWSILMDLKILLKTICVVFAADGN